MLLIMFDKVETAYPLPSLTGLQRDVNHVRRLQFLPVLKALDTHTHVLISGHDPDGLNHLSLWRATEKDTLAQDTLSTRLPHQKVCELHGASVASPSVAAEVKVLEHEMFQLLQRLWLLISIPCFAAAPPAAPVPSVPIAARMCLR